MPAHDGMVSFWTTPGVGEAVLLVGTNSKAERMHRVRRKREWDGEEGPVGMFWQGPLIVDKPGARSICVVEHSRRQEQDEPTRRGG